jgi:hypothetical protein
MHLVNIKKGKGKEKEKKKTNHPSSSKRNNSIRNARHQFDLTTLMNSRWKMELRSSKFPPNLPMLSSIAFPFGRIMDMDPRQLTAGHRRAAGSSRHLGGGGLREERGGVAE